MDLVCGMAGKADLQEFKKLLADGGLPELGPGPRAGVLPEAKLNNRLNELLADANLSAQSRELVTGLILLWHDHMDEAHNIAQGIENADGSFLHGIVHRREPDYGNAAYWFRRVGAHPAFPALAERVGKLAEMNSIKSELMPGGKWDAFAFIHLCEKAARMTDSDAQVKLLRAVQGIESEVLLEYFLRDA